MPHTLNRKACLPLPSAFTRRFSTDDAMRPVWDRYRQGDDHAFGELIEFYLPLLCIAARTLKRRNPGFFLDEVEALISDGVPPLMYEIQRADMGGGLRFIWQVLRVSRRAMRLGTIARHWGRSQQRVAEDKILKAIAARLTQDNGRVPAPEEINAELRGLITNPLIQFGNPARAKPAGDRLEWLPRQRHDGHAVDRRAIDAEMIQLVRSELSGDDLRIVELAMEGESAKQIGVALGLKGTPRQIESRVNGALWAARSNARLAAACGFERATRPAMNHRTRHAMPSTRQPRNAMQSAVAYIADRIADGTIHAGEKVSTSMLSHRLNVDQKTVWRACQVLKRRGLLETRRNAGTFVREIVKSPTKLHVA